jgi:hypothetical protein
VDVDDAAFDNTTDVEDIPDLALPVGFTVLASTMAVTTDRKGWQKG